MKEIGKIEELLRKFSLLGGLYEEIILSDIATEEELNVTKLKAKVAKEDMLKLTHKLNSVILRAEERLK
ncbi:MAG: hypothetical protein V1859_10175 [archaeon]